MQKLTKKHSKTNLLKRLPDETWEEASLCVHYRRRCLIQPPCCPGKFFACRICHDELADHAIGAHRYEITKIKCGMCQKVQDVSNKCVDCGIQFATYFCGECRLWSTSTEASKKEIYHCKGCKLCRNGKREDWKHCERCCVCYAKDHFDEHVCYPRKIARNCPVCKQFMFDAREQVLFLGCGHPVHESCLDILFRDWKMYRCFTCRVLMLRVPEDQVQYSEEGTISEVTTGWPRLTATVSKDYPVWQPPCPPCTDPRRTRRRPERKEAKEDDSEHKPPPPWGRTMKCMECAEKFPSIELLIEHSKKKHSPEVKLKQKERFKALQKSPPRSSTGTLGLGLGRFLSGWKKTPPEK